MNELNSIIKKYEEFAEYLNQINLNELKSNFSRKELENLKSTLYNIKLRSVGYELTSIIEEMKTQEYPELLGVHHYPEIKEIGFLSEEEKIRLDDYLFKMRIGSYLWTESTAFCRTFKNVKSDVEILEFLRDKGILEKNYRLNICDNCNDFRILSQRNIDDYKRYFELLNNKNLYTGLSWGEEQELYNLTSEINTEYICMDCDNEFEIKEDMINKIINNSMCWVYKLIKDRDKSWDSK